MHWRRWTWMRIQKSEKQLWSFIKSWGHRIALTKRTNFALKLRFPVNIFNFFKILAQGARIRLSWHSLAGIRISLRWANSYDNVSIIQICLCINSREFLYHCEDSRGVIPLFLRIFPFQSLTHIVVYCHFEIQSSKDPQSLIYISWIRVGGYRPTQ